MASPYQKKLYEEHKDLFMLIMRLGNKVAIKNQLKVLALKLGLYNDTEHFDNAIKKLKENHLIEFYNNNSNYRNSKTYLIIVVSPVLGWVHQELKQKGIPINKSKVETDKDKGISDRVDKSMFRIEYAINFLRDKEVNSTDELFAMLEADSSVLFTERRGLEYYSSFVHHYQKQLWLDKKECESMARELHNVNKKQKQSVPSRLGKGKAYKEEKDKDIYVDYNVEKETPDNLKEIYTPDDISSNDRNLDEINKKKFDNNFNSFLERGCWLRLDSVKNIKKPEFKETTKNTYFTLYILDINRKLNHIKVAEKTSKAYLMLKNFLEEGHDYRDKNMCKNCKKNINNKNYEYIQRISSISIPVSDYNDIATVKRAFFYCDPNDKNNNDYKSCTDNKIRLRRKVYMNVVVLTWNEKDKNTLLTDCNYEKGKSYFSDGTTKLTEFQKECKYKWKLHDNDLKKIRLKVYDYNLDRNYLGGKSAENITRKNKKASLKKTIKEEIKETGAETGVSLEKETIEKMADVMVAKILEKIEI